MSGYSKADLRELINEVLDKRDSLELAQNSETAREHGSNCPECYAGIIEDLKKKSTVKCADCGLPLGKKEFAQKLDKCPNCGSEDVEETDPDFL